MLTNQSIYIQHMYEQHICYRALCSDLAYFLPQEHRTKKGNVIHSPFRKYGKFLLNTVFIFIFLHKEIRSFIIRKLEHIKCAFWKNSILR